MSDPAAPQAREVRVLGLIGTAHFLSHFYILAIPPLFLFWRDEFQVSFAMLGLSSALLSGTTAVLQTPVGFLTDRYGAKTFLVGGTLLMCLGMAAMAIAPSYWMILVLAVVSGIGNSVIHPVDYAILAGSIGKDRMGRAFAFHTFTGNLGFAAGPPVIVLLAGMLGWRGALAAVGLVGLPVVGAILWQSRILADQAKPRAHEAGASGLALLASLPMLMFFLFMLTSAMAGGAVQAFLIATLAKLWGTPLAIGSAALTSYMVGATAGVLIGGWVADRYGGALLGFTILTTLATAALFLLVGMLALPAVLLVGTVFIAGLIFGASRTPRDIMIKDAAPPGQIGKVFGFVSSGLPMGMAITPVPFGLLLDLGRPDLVLPLVAVILVASIFTLTTARSAGKVRLPVAAE
ncbi:MAG: MFS transporter [Acetobacteraceae bacterium]|nr:MFS transporter [Acetobacteraceae bacterium]